MTKREFVIEFILNKAKAAPNEQEPFYDQTPKSWALHAIEAWEVIEKECPILPPTPFAQSLRVVDTKI